MPEYGGYDKTFSEAAKKRQEAREEGKRRMAVKDPVARILKLEREIADLKKQQVTIGDEFISVVPPNVAFTGRIPEPQTGTLVVVTGNLNGLPASGVALYQTTPTTI
jgi:uncharacterized protein YdcH (DUF465 family)